MSVQIDRGLTDQDIKNEVLRELKSELNENQVDELFDIFFDYSEWNRTIDRLIHRISTAHDPSRLEEAARVVINDMIYYSKDGKYYVYGG